MTLIVCGQDIRFLSLALVRDGLVDRERTDEVSPERYLAAVDAALREWNVAQGELDAVAIVTGPGSFTASRASVTIGNAIAFARSIPIISLENPDRASVRDLAALLPSIVPNPNGFAVPTYDRPPHITYSRS